MLSMGYFMRTAWPVPILVLSIVLNACGGSPSNQNLGSLHGNVIWRTTETQPTPTTDANALTSRADTDAAAAAKAQALLQTIPITITGPTIVHVFPDESGNYTATDLDPGSYTISADLGMWSAETTASINATVRSQETTMAPDLLLTPAGGITGVVHATTEGAPLQGVRVRMLGTSLRAVTDDAGIFVINNAPVGVYELRADHPDFGTARRAGITIVAFEQTTLDPMALQPGTSGLHNGHPEFALPTITLLPNRTPTDAVVRPLPYVLPEGTVRRFDAIQLHAPATDPNGDPLQYVWSVSGGEISDPLTDAPLWYPDATAGSRATLSVTVRDGYGGLAAMSTDVNVADVFAESADQDGDDIVHAYRIGTGPWQIDWVRPYTPDEVLANQAVLPGDDGISRIPYEHAEHILNVDKTQTMVLPIWAKPYILYLQQGVLHRYDTRDASRTTLAAQPRVDIRARRPYLALPYNNDVHVVYRPNTTPNILVRLNPATGAVSTLITCVNVCRDFAVDHADTSTTQTRFVAVFSSDENNASVFDLWRGDQQTQGLAPLHAAFIGPVGYGLFMHGQQIAYVDGYSDRSARNNVALWSNANGTPTQATGYAGYYTMILWGHDGASVYITEQEYRALRHRPFIRRTVLETGVSSRYPAKSDDMWQADKVWDHHGDTVLIRRVTSVDWPEDADASRSDIVRVQRDGGFQP